MSVTWSRELLCSPVGLTPVFMPSISFWRIPGAKAAIAAESFRDIEIEIQEMGLDLERFGFDFDMKIELMLWLRKLGFLHLAAES